jgi:tRNA G46 methylase TrmB
MAASMRPGGLLHIATDVEAYAKWAREVMREGLLPEKPAGSTMEIKRSMPDDHDAVGDDDENDAGDGDAGGDVDIDYDDDDDDDDDNDDSDAFGSLISSATDASRQSSAPYSSTSSLRETLEDVKGRAWVDLNSVETGYLEARPAWRPVTKYETRGVQELGHNVFDLCFQRAQPAVSAASDG